MPREQQETARLRTMVTALREVILAGEAYRRAAAGRLGVTGTEAQVIGYLVTRGPLQPNELAEAVAVSSGSITAIIDSLEAHGLVERRAHPTDRRRSVVHPSTHGAIVFAIGAAWLDDVGRLIPKAERADVARALETLADGLRQRAVSVLDETLPAPPDAD